MTRILFVSTSTTIGGAEKTVYTLATLLDPRVFQLAGVVSLKPAGAYAKKLEKLGKRAVSLELKGRPGLKQLSALVAEIEHQKPDIVHAVMYQAIQLCRLAKRRSAHKFKLISSPRVSYRSRSSLTLLVDRVLKSSDDLLIAESESSRKYLINHCGYAPAKVKTVYNGVDLAGCPPSKLDRQGKRLELRLAGPEILLGTVGRLEQQKGHATLVEAIAKLKNRLPLRCAVIGEGPRRAALEIAIRKNALERTLWLLGEREDIPAWLSSFDIFVLPSLWEGLPNALLEAMALGLPVLASAVDGVPELIEDGVNGLLVPPRDPAALARRIAELADNPALRARLGAAAQKTVSERFTVLKMIESYQQIYSAL